jgi:hypothetical protein
MTDSEAATLTLQGLADQARGKMNAAAEATRQAAHSYAAGHTEAGTAFTRDAWRCIDEASHCLLRLNRLGRGLNREVDHA